MGWGWQLGEGGGEVGGGLVQGYTGLRGMWEDSVTCRGHPYMFINFIYSTLSLT